MIDKLQQEAKNAVNVMDSSKALTVQGTDATVEAQKALERISVQVMAILDMNTQVATATEEQSFVANEINTNMDIVNSSVQKGLSASKDLEVTSQKLEQLANILDQHVGSFKV
jgi:methyl-accepting chemotaxis protein